MKGYIDQLNAQTAELASQRELNKVNQRTVDPRVQPEWKPLPVQIEVLMRSLPPAQRDRPWSLDELQPRLTGKFQPFPHKAHIGAALRELGWVTKRNWTHNGGGRRYWLPPSFLRAKR